LVVGVAFLAGCSHGGEKGDGSAPPDGGQSPTDTRVDKGGGQADVAACVNSLDCGSDQVCDTQARRCVQCVADPDCKTGMRCVANVCTTMAPICQSSLDCASNAANPICDVPTGRCVRCLTASDCPASNDCTSQTCVAYTTCMNSLGCPSGQVCDTTRMRCVQCVGDNDCATDQKCASNVCRKKCTSDNMCTSMGMLCNTTGMYCVSCLMSTDCKPAEYCSNGACLADVCTQGTSSCNNNAVLHCKSDGSGFDPAVACTTGQTCSVSGGAASCKTQACTPTVTYCDPGMGSEKVLVCSADGLTMTAKTDCAASSQVCVAGACAAVVCPKGMRFCQGQDLRQCTTKGDASTLVQSCTTTQYCDATSMTCKARVCTPNQPGCSGNILAMCNGDGSGFLSGGTDCSPNYCSGGACISAFLNETFEDQSSARWTAGSGSYTISAASTPGANGTMYALSMTKNLSGTVPDGLSYSFTTPVQPKSVSYWTKTSYTGSGMGYTRLVNGTDVVFYSYFTSSYLYLIYGGTTNYSTVAATATTWYHVELRNIDWTARTFDLYVNGVSVAPARPFSGTSTSVGRVELFSSTISYTAYWDEIELFP
jgi:hypothetical protein